MAAKDGAKPRAAIARAHRLRALLARGATYFFLALGAVVMLFPFFWMFTSAFKTPQEVATFPPSWLPQSPRFENFATVFEKAPFGLYFLNSVMITTASVLGTGLVTILAAFAFSRLKFPGRNLLFTLLLSLMMIPFEMLVITNYETIAAWRLIDNRVSLFIPFLGSIFYTYILRNFFLSIPDGLYWSARVDGASNWKYLWKVMVPIARPALTTIILLNAITSWNSFMWPMLVINSTANRTLPLGLYVFMTEGGINYELLMAASTVVVLPIIILFLFARKQIVGGVARGGMKG
ncbi:MAG: carbohydrate ABC transporter permease [Eubacteriales bacterium]|nr:carbohydrate ABC transporter permease [Eubacteriales bacterium]